MSRHISSPLQATQAAREEDFLLTRRQWLTQSGTGLGAVPLDILETQVKTWLTRQAAKKVREISCAWAICSEVMQRAVWRLFFSAMSSPCDEARLNHT